MLSFAGTSHDTQSEMLMSDTTFYHNRISNMKILILALVTIFVRRHAGREWARMPERGSQMRARMRPQQALKQWGSGQCPGKK